MYAIPLPATNTLRVAGSDSEFPVNRIFCVGRNYAEHAREMGHDPDREPPFFFAKPATAVVRSGASVPFPMMTEDLHHEVELVVALAKGGANVSEADALDLVYGYAVGIDMTRRDLQAEAKSKSRPWDMSKGFDDSAPMGELHEVSEVGHPGKGSVTLKVNGDLRQKGDLEQQIWAVPETISYLSSLVELRPGDLIMTGTPSGVGPVQRGELVVGEIDGLGSVEITYA